MKRIVNSVINRMDLVGWGTVISRFIECSMLEARSQLPSRLREGLGAGW